MEAKNSKVVIETENVNGAVKLPVTVNCARLSNNKRLVYFNENILPNALISFVVITYIKQ